MVRAFLVAVPVLVPFFQENGLSQTQIYVLQSVYALTIVFFEIPSGYFADRFGRRRSMLLGAVLSTLGFVLYSLSYGFAAFLVAEIVFGVGYTFISGADVALAYDSLAAERSESRYLHFESRANSYSGISEAGASVLGGLLALISLRTPVVAMVAIYASLIPLTLLLTEPPRLKRAASNAFVDALRITRYALHGHREIKWLILYGAAMGTLTYTMVWITQPYYQLVGVPLGWFGALWAAQLFAMGIFSRGADRYERWLGKRQALASFVGIGVASYVLLGVAPFMATLPAILGFYFVRGVHMPILQNYVNELVESDIRATVLSVKNVAQKLLYAALGPVIGVVVDAHSLQTALLFSAAIYGCLGVIILVGMKRQRII